MVSNNYESCIKIGNQRLIAPLLDDETRRKMRYYRDVAIALESKSRKRVSIENISKTNTIDDDQLFKLTDSTGIPSNDINSSSKDCLTNSITSRERRNSYTLEYPSPVMLEYVQSLNQNDASLLNDDDSRDAACYWNSNSAHLNNSGKTNRKLFDKELGNITYRKSTSLPNHQSTESSVMHTFNSVDCLFGQNIVDVCSANVADHSVNRDISYLQDRSHFNDSFLQDFQTIYKNAVQDEDTEFIEKIPIEYSNAHMHENHKHEPYNGFSVECDNYLQLMERLKIKHEQQIASLLEEQRKEFDMLTEQFLKMDFSRENSKNANEISALNLTGCESLTLNNSQISESSDPINISEEYCAPTRLSDLIKNNGIQESCIPLAISNGAKECEPDKQSCTSISTHSEDYYSPAATKVVVSNDDSLNGQNHFDECLKSDNTKDIIVSNGVEDNSYSSASSVIDNKSNNAKCTMKAASVINAAVRGYLIRRLFKTDRVQMLVQTIKDCLATATSLQNESNLGVSELDLQSRLLQQLTVACNDLQAIFSLSIKERMRIIATDREKKKHMHSRITPLPLSNATRRSLERKIIRSAPSAIIRNPSKRFRSKSVSCSNSDYIRNICTNQKGIVTAVELQKISSKCNRKPWR